MAKVTKDYEGRIRSLLRQLSAAQSASADVGDPEEPTATGEVEASTLHLEKS